MNRIGAGRPGQATIIFAASFTALMMMLALSVDLGNLWLQRRILQNIADAAVLAGAQQYIVNGPQTGGPEIDSVKGVADARAYADSHGITCLVPGPDCVVTYPVPAYGVDQWQYIQISVRRTVPLHFARVLGFTEQSVSTTATARAVRVGFQGDAVVGLNQVVLERENAHPLTSSFMVRGSVLSWGDIVNSASTGYLRMQQGQANAGGIIQYPNNVDPVGLNNFSPLTDPFQEAINQGQLSLPAYQTPSGQCDLRPIPPLGPLDPPDTLETVDPTAEGLIPQVTIPPGRHVRLRPGRYCSITVQGWAYFDDTPAGTPPYIIEEFLVTNRNPPEKPEIQTYFRYLNRNVNPAPQLPANYGTFIMVYGRVNLSGDLLGVTSSHFELKGDPRRQDILFYIPPNVGSSNKYIHIDTVESSNLVGSIYAPLGEIWVRGNPDNTCMSNPSARGARVTRGGALSQRGGRVVGYNVRLMIWSPVTEVSPPNYPSCGVDFPPLTQDFTFFPALAPASP